MGLKNKFGSCLPSNEGSGDVSGWRFKIYVWIFFTSFSYETVKILTTKTDITETFLPLKFTADTDGYFNIFFLEFSNAYILTLYATMEWKGKRLYRYTYTYNILGVYYCCCQLVFCLGQNRLAKSETAVICCNGTDIGRKYNIVKYSGGKKWVNFLPVESETALLYLLRSKIPIFFLYLEKVEYLKIFFYVSR